MKVMTKFGWMVWCVVICGGVAACSGADTPASEETVGSSQEDLRKLRLCGGPLAWECGGDRFCNARVGHCPGKRQVGRCEKKPEACLKIYAPVCGCDGATYGNDCEAAAAGVSIASKGECEPEPAFCGGIANIPCPDGQSCIDDPNDGCDPNAGGADCGGICIDPPQPAFCGGIAGLPCPEGQSCVDDPSDDCDPNTGGADCGGMCVTTETCGDAQCAPGFVCCNPLRGICTKPGMVCIQ